MLTKAITKANTADVTASLLKKASTAALVDKSDEITTNNSATACSFGLASDGYHYPDTGSDALVIRTPSGAISANFLGNVSWAAYDGRAFFNTDVMMLGDMRLGAGSIQKTFTSPLFYGLL